MKLKVNDLKSAVDSPANRNISMNFEYRATKLLEISIGWIIYFRMGKMKKLMEQLD